MIYYVETNCKSGKTKNWSFWPLDHLKTLRQLEAQRCSATNWWLARIFSSNKTWIRCIFWGNTYLSASSHSRFGVAVPLYWFVLLWFFSIGLFDILCYVIQFFPQPTSYPSQTTLTTTTTTHYLHTTLKNHIQIFVAHSQTFTHNPTWLNKTSNQKIIANWTATILSKVMKHARNW